jgi:hypothetical protein
VGQPTMHASRPPARRQGCRPAARVLLTAVIGSVLAVSATPHATALAPRQATPSPTPNNAALVSSVSLAETPDGVGEKTDTYLLRAALSPSQVYGHVTLTDNGTQLASADNYQALWSYSAPTMRVGDHHLTVVFTPVAASGYAPSQATIDYLVRSPSPSTSPNSSPSVTASPTPSQTKTAVAVAGVPSKTATRSSTATTSASASVAAASPTSASSPHGSLPFTGLDTDKLLVDSAVLIGSGVALLVIAHRRRVERPPGRHLA